MQLKERTSLEYRASNSPISSLLEGLRHFMAMLTSEAESGAVNRKVRYTKERDR